MRNGSCSGSRIAEKVTIMCLVRPKIDAAKIFGQGLQPFSAPWCSSVLMIEKPFFSPYSAMSSISLCMAL
jgi:hypothetical protein